MINIKSDYEISLMRKAGNIVYRTHKYLEPYIKPGITTKELDKLAYDFIISQDATPSFLNYNGFPGSICTSVNDEVVHGIPSNRKLKNGDIIGIDIGANYKGYHGDSAWSYKVGSVSKEKEYLLEHTEKALFEGLKQVKPGNRIGDISNAIETYANAHNLGVVRELVGHGVGSNLHEEPDVPNYGKKGTGPLLKEGMTIAIEPMLNLGTHKIYILDDDWTIITRDGSPSAHFEHSVVVTKDGYRILTGDDNFE
ncbi:MAG: type I methionyl aminopeptidase [Erysipelotrichaceae bacterium]|nr:type I methionyl aminopeptidase [Erysipelotrichaceae bacterium]MDD6093320.1 type I methionyl aminopeptidase [bacterium]MDY3934316.1 type I methionyl aminopeptidase [Bacilli bacterium]